jgi:hypothetical protein
MADLMFHRLIGKRVSLAMLVAVTLWQSVSDLPGTGPKQAPAEGAGGLLVPTHFEKLRDLIRPSEGESRWEQIPWLTRIHEARGRAAAEGKPILLWSAGGCCPLGGC